MTGRYGAGIAGVILGLLAWVPVFAQTGDTARVVTDTGTVVTDSTQAADSVRPAVDTSAVSSKDAIEGHAKTVVLRGVPDSVVADLKGDKAYEYANDSSYWRWRDYLGRQRTSRGSGGQPYDGQSSGGRSSRGWLSRFLASVLFEYIILFVLGGILLYAIVRIIVANRLQLFYRPPKRPMVGKPEEEGSPEDDLEGQLMHFIQIKDYRQAVRHLYLKTLRLLNDSGMIRYHQESTNHEYWKQLKATPQGAPFRDLTMIYEQVWYGEFPLGDTLFNRLHQYFEDFYKSVRT